MARPVSAVFPAVLASITLILLCAGCGGGSAGPPGVANLGSAPTTTKPRASAPAGNSGASAAGALKYAQCMRTHGFPTFPDPNAQGGFDDLPASANPANPSPQYSHANKTCETNLGSGELSPARQQEVEANLLRFAQCMRTHGVPSYPDPTFKDGGVSQSIGKNSGVDPNSSRFKRAQKTCQTAPLGGK